MNYREMYGNAINRLSETYLTPEYAEAKEEFYKVFEAAAAAGIIGIVEDGRPEPDLPITKELVEDLERDVEILRRVNYPHPFIDFWEEDLRNAKAQLAKV